MGSVPDRTLNDLFMQRLETPEDRVKLGQAAGSYVRDKLREVAFSRKIIVPEPVTRDDCQVSINHDTLVKIVWIEPNSRAAAITFRGEPKPRWVQADRVECPFFTIASDKFEKTEQELLAYQMPITKIIEDNTVKDIEEIEDFYFMHWVEAAVRATGKVRKSPLVAQLDWDELTPNTKQDFIAGFKLLSGSRRRCQRILMTEVDYEDILGYTIQDFGEKIASEVIVDGYKYNLFLGRELVRTIKTDILKPGNIYFFTEQDFLGKNYVLNNTKFYIDKVANLITWMAWEDIGMILANVASISKIELYQYVWGDEPPQGWTAEQFRILFGPPREDELGGEFHDTTLVQPLINMS